jgi:hypothetical protein
LNNLGTTLAHHGKNAYLDEKEVVKKEEENYNFYMLLYEWSLE